MMKPRLFFCVIFFTFTSSTYATESLCQQKTSDIQHEIGMARKNNNQRRVTGLERALTETRAECTRRERLKAKKDNIAQQHKKGSQPSNKH